MGDVLTRKRDDSVLDYQESQFSSNLRRGTADERGLGGCY